MFSRKDNTDRGRNMPGSGYQPQQQMWNSPDENYGAMNMGMHMNNQSYDPFQYNGGGSMVGPEMMMNMNMTGDPSMNWGGMMNWGGYGGPPEYGGPPPGGPPPLPPHGGRLGMDDRGSFDPRQRGGDYYPNNRSGRRR